MTQRIWSVMMSAAIAPLIGMTPQCVAGTHTITVAQEARQTLKDVEGSAAKTADEAFQLETISKTLRGDANIVPLNTLRANVNTMGQEIATLEARRESLEPWEQASIDKVLPLLKDAATNTERAIRFFNDNPGLTWSPEYSGHMAKVNSDTAQIVKTLRTYLKYEKVQEQEKRLERAVEAGDR